MKKFLFIMLIFILTTLSACAEKPIVKASELHKILGKPSGNLFGSHSDIYLLENKTTISIDYDEKSTVKKVVINNNNSSNDIETSDFLMCIKEKSQKEVQKILGEPSGALFGAYGDVYLLENKTKITIYYDFNNKKVKNILIENESNEKTYSTE